MNEGMGLDEFLGHKSSAGGGGRSKTVKWRDRTPPVIDTWLHTKGRIIALWKHGWVRLMERERDGEKSLEIWSGDFVCWESEAVLKKQYHRHDDGRRKVAPTVCPMCLLLEYLRDEIRQRRLLWTAPVFEFKGTEQKQVFTAGGMCKLYDDKKLTRGQLDEIRRAGIRRDEAWKENCAAKCNYLFTIVDENDLQAGPQVAIETTALGDAVKDVIREQMEALGDAEGNPLRTPYCIRWKYRPDEQEFAKKYAALPLPKNRLSPEIRAAIYDAPLPDVTPYIERGNIDGLRAVMEKNCLLEGVPWDEIFGPAERELRRSKGGAPAAPAPAQEPPKQATRRPAQAPGGKPKRPDYPPGTVFVACDHCGEDMADNEDTCWNCGAKYELGADPPPAPAPAGKHGSQPAADISEDDIPFD